MFNENEDKRNYEEEIKTLEAQLAEIRAMKAKEEEKAVKLKEQQAAQARKEEANIVNAAIDKYEDEKAICNKKIEDAFNEYKAKVDAAEKELKEFESDAESKLSKFLETHESFHYTYKSNDGKTIRRYDYRNKAYDSFDNFNAWVKAINDLWNF